MKVKVNRDMCSGCGVCTKDCPQQVFEIRVVRKRRLAVPVAEDKCSGCRTCEKKCPQKAIEIIQEMLKIRPPENYPPEEGHFLRGNDYSPAAVVVLLDSPYGEISPEAENLVRVAVESGAALAGTLQTANIGIEKIIANTIANPNIRYLIICGKGASGHMPGEALNALIKNGLDSNRRIRKTRALKPYLLNIPKNSIKRFRKQVTNIDLAGVSDPEILKKAVWTCYQEKPTAFQHCRLYDTGAYPDTPICQRIKWKITRYDLISEDEMPLLLQEIHSRSEKNA
jgi:tetrahydromethanopterin S-methyltransferase subunit A